MSFRNSLLALSGFLIISLFNLSPALAQEQVKRPPLVIYNSPIPEDIRDKVYSKPVQVREIYPSEIVGRDYYSPTSTHVAHKINVLDGELHSLQSNVSGLSSELSLLQRKNENKASEYYAAIATINTQLQSGTTPGNPRLLKKVNTAQANLDNLSGSVTQLNRLAVSAAGIASEASFLLESTRATYSLSGAIEEDHVKLTKLEDSTNNTLVIIERILNNVNDDITRTSSYLSSERNNLRTLSLGVIHGDLFGKSLANHPFANAKAFNVGNINSDIADTESTATSSSSSNAESLAPSNPRPLAKIRFDRPNVKYEQPIYMAINEALERYPNARFDLIAVHPSTGNAAEIAIESTRARRNAERVLRTLTQMGLPLERIDLSYGESKEASTNEVHIYIR